MDKSKEIEAGRFFAKNTDSLKDTFITNDTEYVTSNKAVDLMTAFAESQTKELREEIKNLEFYISQIPQKGKDATDQITRLQNREKEFIEGLNKIKVFVTNPHNRELEQLIHFESVVERIEKLLTNNT